jgi:hypothetical protein
VNAELVGYVASALILVSLLLTSVVRLRIVNAIGAAVFTAYGLLIDAPPVWAMNGAIVLVDLWQLWALLRDRDDETVEAVEVPWDSPVLDRVLRVHAEDIARYVPGGPPTPSPDTRAWLVLRDTTPASVLLAHAEDDRVVVDLDYATPATRDLRAGKLLHDDLDVLGQLGDGQVVAHGGPREHQRYLAAVGFAPTGSDPTGPWARTS